MDAAATAIKRLKEYGLKNYRDIFEQCQNNHSGRETLVQKYPAQISLKEKTGLHCFFNILLWKLPLKKSYRI